MTTMALGLLAALITAGAVARAESTVSGYGETTEVAVARHLLDPGTEIAADDLDMRDLPVALIPQDPAPEPIGRVVTGSIMPGEVILEARVASEGAHGPAALLAADQVAIAIPLDGPAPTLAIDDQVDLLGGEGPTVLVRRARVIETTQTAVTVGVDRDKSELIAGAVLRGPVFVALAQRG